MSYNILPLFIPFAGCKNRCVYCNQNHITGINDNLFLSSVKDQLKNYLSLPVVWDEIAFYGGSFTCLKRDDRLLFLDLVRKHSNLPIRVSTSPACITNQIIDELTSYKVKVVELGVQSLSDNVLQKNGRNYSVETSLNTIRILNKKFKVGIQLMCGMYEETIEDFVATVGILKREIFDFSRIYPTVVLQQTDLEQLYHKGVYKPLSAHDAIKYAAFLYIHFISSNIKVIRMGLHCNNDIKKFVVAGPYHPAFGDLVKTFILAMYLNCKNTITVGSRYLSSAYGYRGILRSCFDDQISISKYNKQINWYNICKKILGTNSESCSWILEEQTDCFAKKIAYKANN